MDSFPSEVLERLKSARVAAGFSVENPEHAVPLVQSLLDGGITAIELTLRTPVALEALQAICNMDSDMLVGAGTILSKGMVEEVKKAGAHFGVSPGLNPRVIEAAQEAGLPFAPGICTPSGIEAAAALGCHVLKFFPAQPSGGVAYLRSMSAPYKHLGIQYFPLGGINSDNMMDFLNEPNVVAIGGTWIVKKQLVEQEDWAGITQRARQVVSLMNGVAASA